MEKQLHRRLAAAALFTSLLGTLCHFLYEWSGKSTIVGLFCPVNESTWEHIKLLFFPMLLTVPFLCGKFRGAYPELCSALLRGLLLGCLLIPVLFYTYTGILGYHISFVDIAIFFISTAAAFLTACRLAKTGTGGKPAWLWKLLTFLLSAMFFVFTYYPPDIGLFRIP